MSPNNMLQNTVNWLLATWKTKWGKLWLLLVGLLIIGVLGSVLRSDNANLRFPNAFAYWSAQACQRGEPYSRCDMSFPPAGQCFRGYVAVLSSSTDIFAAAVFDARDHTAVIEHRFCPDAGGACYNADTGAFTGSDGLRDSQRDLVIDMSRDQVEAFLHTLPARCPSRVEDYLKD